MKIKQVVTTEFNTAYCNYNGIEFTDATGNEVSVRMSDDQLLEFAGMVNRKAERIQKERAEEAAELAEENTDE